MDPIEVRDKLKAARESFERAVKEFHQVLKSKKLIENQSIAEKRQEKAVVDQLVKACVGLDQMNAGEGVMALAVVSIRENLSMRHRVNELEHKLVEQSKELLKVKKCQK